MVVTTTWLLYTVDVYPVPVSTGRQGGSGNRALVLPCAGILRLYVVKIVMPSDTIK